MLSLILLLILFYSFYLSYFYFIFSNINIYILLIKADQLFESEIKIKEFNFKYTELEQENKNQLNQITKLKLDIEDLNKVLDNIYKEKLNSNKKNNDISEINELSKRDILKKLQINLSNLSLSLNKNKKKYNQEIYKLSTELEKIKNNYQSKKKGKIKRKIKEK
jgi:hypothetical protein